MNVNEPVSIAIETSCGAGGAAVGRGDAILAEIAFDASHRHATHLVSRLKELVERAGLRPADLTELYVSAGPGSFTGLRIGITVARTLAQAVGGQLAEHCVAVPTAAAVAHGCRELDWRNLAVLFDAGDGSVYATTFSRRDGEIVQENPPAVMPFGDFLEAAPRPISLIGEWVRHISDFRFRIADCPSTRAGAPRPEDSETRNPKSEMPEGVTFLAPESPLHLPSARSVWEVGRRMASAGRFTEYHRLLPIYSRQPTAVTVWEKKNCRL